MHDPNGLAEALFLILIGIGIGGGMVAAIRDWRAEKPRRHPSPTERKPREGTEMLERGETQRAPLSGERRA